MSLTGLKLDKWVSTLKELQDKNTITLLCKDNKMTYSHVSSIITELIRHKFISVKQQGREKHITLTDKGMKTIHIINKLEEQLK